MSIQRDNIAFGPAKIVINYGTPITLYSAKAIDVTVTTEYAEVNSDQFGQGTKVIVDQTIEAMFAPQSLYALLTSVWPSTHINPSIGTRILGSSPPTVQFHGEANSLLTFLAGGIIGIPGVDIGVDKGEFSQMKIGGVCQNGKTLGSASSLYTLADTGGTFGTPSNPDYLMAGDWNFTWKTSALGGELLESVSIKPDFKTTAVKAGKRTLDWRHGGCQFNADVVSSQDPAILAALYNDGSTFAYGARNTASAGALVFTNPATSNTITIGSAMIEKDMKQYSLEAQRNKAISFRSANLTGARIAWT